MQNYAPLHAGFGFSQFRRYGPEDPFSHPVSAFTDHPVISQQLPPHQQTTAYHRPDVVHNTIEYKRHHNHLFKEKYPDFPLLGDRGNNVDYVDQMKTHQAVNPLMQAFFSQQNIDQLQGAIIDDIYKRSQGRYKISRQSDTQLFVIMRSIYLRAPKDPYNQQTIAHQVSYLNGLVLQEVIPIIIENIQAHLGYIRDHGQMTRPIDRAQSTNTAGLKLCRGPASLIP